MSDKVYDADSYFWHLPDMDETTPVSELTKEQLQQALCECLEVISKAEEHVKEANYVFSEFSGI